MRRSSLRILTVLLGGSLFGGIAAVSVSTAQDEPPLLLGVPAAAPAAAAPAIKPVVKPATAAAVKPATTAAAKPAAKPVAAAKPAAVATAKPVKTTKTAKTAAPAIPPEARRAALLAAMTGQAVVPQHAHVFEPGPTSCPANPDAIGVSRVMKVDTTGGFYVGQTYHTRLPLQPKEVVLTFDDGPMHGRTDRVLEALDHECTKATFFIVGQMAKAYPETLRKTAAAGHTIGYHTMTHPLAMVKWPLPKAQENIQQGWQTVDQILYGQVGDRPATPFFRYPGLFNSRAINEWFNGMNVGVWAIDAAGNDWLKGYITVTDGPNVMREALKELEARDGGILLLHDIKESSSSIVAPLLKELKARGFRIVQIVPKNPPPKLVNGPVAGVVPTLAETAVPVGERAIDGYDTAKQLAQGAAGRTGKSATTPLPSWEAAKPAVAAPATTVAPAAPAAAIPATTEAADPVVTGSIAKPAVPASEGWFSATAASFRHFGLW